PARYAKPEVSSGFVSSIDGYVYRTPAALNMSVAAAPGETAQQPPAPLSTNPPAQTPQGEAAPGTATPESSTNESHVDAAAAAGAANAVAR
ncbi:MAG TPA: hypothetical protein VHK24_03825, partial [Steroidobacter sp.]|nr:hypothetical protein [Steroidobacter sp.]